MFTTGDVVIVKDLKTLLDEGSVKLADGFKDIYVSADKTYAIFSDFNFFGNECVIDEVDSNDKSIPYFLSIGIWVPEFMIMEKPKPKKENKQKLEKPKEKRDKVIEADLADIAAMNVKQEEVAEEKPKVYINQFNGKPFGKLFLKLIELDPKIAEFSNTTFSKLKKHELLYIANLLHNNGVLDEDYARLTKEELVTLCFTAAKKL